MRNESGDVLIVSGARSELIEDARTKLADSPTELRKLTLASILLADGQYSEAAQLASEIMGVGDGATVVSPDTTYLQASLEVAAAVRRSRGLFEEEAKQIPVEGAVRITMERFDKSLGEWEEDLRKLSEGHNL